MEKGKKLATFVGLMTVLAIGAFFSIVAVLAKWQVSATGFQMEVSYKFLNNLSEGAPVKLAGGINVGYVEKIFNRDLQTWVRLHLDEELRNKLPKRAETIFAIYTTGLMGQKYINVTIPPIESDDVFYKQGDSAVGVDPPSIDQMMMAFSSWFDGKNGGQILAEIMQATQQFINNLNAIVGENRQDIRLTIRQARTSFTNLSSQLDILMNKLNVLSGNFTEISNKNKQDIQIMLQNMSLISRDLNLITQRINSGKGSIGKLLTDEQLYVNANEAVRNARELMKILNEKPWLLMYKEQ